MTGRTDLWHTIKMAFWSATAVSITANPLHWSTLRTIGWGLVALFGLYAVEEMLHGVFYDRRP